MHLNQMEEVLWGFAPLSVNSVPYILHSQSSCGPDTFKGAQCLKHSIFICFRYSMDNTLHASIIQMNFSLLSGQFTFILTTTVPARKRQQAKRHQEKQLNYKWRRKCLLLISLSVFFSEPLPSLCLLQNFLYPGIDSSCVDASLCSKACHKMKKQWEPNARLYNGFQAACVSEI